MKDAGEYSSSPSYVEYSSNSMPSILIFGLLSAINARVARSFMIVFPFKIYFVVCNVAGASSTSADHDAFVVIGKQSAPLFDRHG